MSLKTRTSGFFTPTLGNSDWLWAATYPGRGGDAVGPFSWVSGPRGFPAAPQLPLQHPYGQEIVPLPGKGGEGRQRLLQGSGEVLLVTKLAFVTVFQTACQAPVRLGMSSFSPQYRRCPPSTEPSSGTSKLTRALV